MVHREADAGYQPPVVTDQEQVRILPLAPNLNKEVRMSQHYKPFVAACLMVLVILKAVEVGTAMWYVGEHNEAVVRDRQKWKQVQVHLDALTDYVIENRSNIEILKKFPERPR